MSIDTSTPPNVELQEKILNIQTQAIQAESIDQLIKILPDVTALTGTESALIYLHPTETFSEYGFPDQDIDKLKDLCPSQIEKLTDQEYYMVSSSDYWKPRVKLALHPLQDNGSCFGFIGLMQESEKPPIETESWIGLLKTISILANSIVERSKLSQQINHLNTYVTVSSMLAQPVGLHDMLEAALYCCMEATSAQASSVLLLGENKQNFHFYQVEGPAKPVLDAASFPIGEGIAGSVLHSQQSEVINDVQADPRFYGKFDSESEFQTQNMIAIPLTAGDEKIGVLEVLNKVDSEDFTEDERLSLMMIAEEIAFAIRNARMFEYVVNSYCLIRQGENSCRGCKRPLGNWTPCVRYRENITVLNMKPPI